MPLSKVTQRTAKGAMEFKEIFSLKLLINNEYLININAIRQNFGIRGLGTQLLAKKFILDIAISNKFGQ